MARGLGVSCSAPGCEQEALCGTVQGPCCNKHYLRVRAHGGFDLPERSKSRDVTCAHCGTAFDRGYAIANKRGRRPQFCTRKCQADAAWLKAKENIVQRFHARVVKGQADECWPWIGRRDPNGYGRLDYEGRPQSAHRIAYLLANGELRPDMAVCHACDNPPCCNPAHLWAGTQGDNARDMFAKGRNAVIPPRRGEASSKSKLTAAEVIDIFKSAEPNRVIAARHGITATAVYLIKKRRNWAHVTEGL